MQLGHGDPLAGRGPLLLIEVDAESWPRRPHPNLADRLAHVAAAPAGGAFAGPFGLGRAETTGAAAASARPEPAGAGGGGVERVDIRVDGEPVAFEVLADGRHWVAQGECGDLVVTLEARDLPLEEVRLVRVTDLEPYLAASSGRREPPSNA
jgi:hypothetical protein